MRRVGITGRGAGRPAFSTGGNRIMDGKNGLRTLELSAFSRVEDKNLSEIIVDNRRGMVLAALKPGRGLDSVITVWDYTDGSAAVQAGKIDGARKPGDIIAIRARRGIPLSQHSVNLMIPHSVARRDTQERPYKEHYALLSAVGTLIADVGWKGDGTVEVTMEDNRKFVWDGEIWLEGKAYSG